MCDASVAITQDLLGRVGKIQQPVIMPSGNHTTNAIQLSPTNIFADSSLHHNAFQHHAQYTQYLGT